MAALAAVVPYAVQGLALGAMAVGTYAATGGFSSADSVDPPSINDPNAEAARRRALVSAQAKAGRQSSILTSGQGLLDEPTISKPVLLGK